MKRADTAREILAIYKKHGWKLGRVLLTERTTEQLGPETLKELFGSREIIRFDCDAAWFERGSKNGSTAIELRMLAPEPFALFELVPAGEAADSLRAKMELRMSEHASKQSVQKDH